MEEEETEGREEEVDEGGGEGPPEEFLSLGDPGRQQCVVRGERERYYCSRVYSPGRAKAGVVVKMECGQSMG